MRAVADNLRCDFVGLQDGAHQLASGEHLTPAAGEAWATEDRASIPDLLALLRQVEETRAVRQKKQDHLQKARTVLDRVLSIIHKGSSHFAPLVELQANATNLRDQTLAESDQPMTSELENLAEGRHSYCDLLALLEHHDDIDDDRWVQLNESITQTFGKPLAIATARKRLLPACVRALQLTSANGKPLEISIHFASSGRDRSGSLRVKYISRSRGSGGSILMRRSKRRGREMMRRSSRSG